MRALHEVMQYQFMTQVQLASLPPILRGTDVLARAKTGTGKTVAFLLPAIEVLLKNPPASRSAISVLILSPTRELAAQILAEAKQLLTFHSFKTLCIFGGTNIKQDHRALAGQVDFLVATPGRLQDHLQNTPGFARKMDNLRVLIFGAGLRSAAPPPPVPPCLHNRHALALTCIQMTSPSIALLLFVCAAVPWLA